MVGAEALECSEANTMTVRRTTAVSPVSRHDGITSATRADRDRGKRMKANMRTKIVTKAGIAAVLATGALAATSPAANAFLGQEVSIPGLHGCASGTGSLTSQTSGVSKGKIWLSNGCSGRKYYVQIKLAIPSSPTSQVRRRSAQRSTVSDRRRSTGPTVIRGSTTVSRSASARSAPCSRTRALAGAAPSSGS